MELATLKGTEKQISWAKVIRKDRLKVWEAASAEGLQSAESMLGQQSLASWWIANRDKSLEEVCSKLRGVAMPKAPQPATKKPEASAPSVAVVTKKRGPDHAGVSRIDTATGFCQVGPTRDMVTGEIVVDDSLPF